MHPSLQVLVAIFVTTLVNRKIHKSKISQMEGLHTQSRFKECMEGWTRGYEVGFEDGRKNMWLEHLSNPSAYWHKSQS